LNGFESDLERIQRLSALRWAASEKPKEILFSDEAVRQLGREVDELNSTRVGPSSQTLKKRALDLYAKLRAKPNPDYIGSDLKALATTLDELAAKMADITDLATTPPRIAPSLVPQEANDFLPSGALADATRWLAKQQRALLTQVTNLASDLTSRLRPGVWSSSSRVVLWQIAHADALARDIDEFVLLLVDAERTLGLNEATIQALREAAKEAKEARRRLAEAAKKAAETNTADAGAFRVAAEVLLRVTNERLMAVTPPGIAPPIGDSLRDAQRAMRKAIQQLAPDSDAGAAEKAMRDAAKMIGKAAKQVGK
jgi:hypothetical protein